LWKYQVDRQSCMKSLALDWLFCVPLLIKERAHKRESAQEHGIETEEGRKVSRKVEDKSKES